MANTLSYSPDEKPEYAFCEPVHAAPLARWCIRRLDGAGLKLGGGITTSSLCGRTKQGWDLEVRIRPEMLVPTDKIVCLSCKPHYLRLQAEKAGKR